MFLEYGLNQHGEMIHIDLAKRGLGDLVCPYCNGRLIARKGSEKIHHFAHAGETCRAVSDREDSAFRLPFYDKFDLGLSPRQLAFITKLNENKYADETETIIYNLEKNGFIKEAYKIRAYDEGYSLTSLGKIPLGLTSLEKFAELQGENWLKRHEKLSQEISETWEEIKTNSQRIQNLLAKRAKHIEEHGIEQIQEYGHWDDREIERRKISLERAEGKLPNLLIDLNIFRAQLRRVFSASLYFLEIKHTGGTLYKVGITNRPIEERIEEISRDIAPHLSGAKINLLRQLQRRGAIEFYFKHRYKENQQRLGSLTEYLAFDDRKAVLSDLSKLGDYTPDDFMLAILAGNPSEIEATIEEEKRRTIEEERQQLLREQHRAATKAGMERAATEGVHIGRPKDESAATVAKFPQVVELLRQGRAIKAIERETGVAKNTIKKVRDALKTE